MPLSLTDFINTHNGIPNVGVNPEDRGQCTGLVIVWLNNLGLDIIYGNAKDLLANASSATYDIISRDPSNFPLSGDVFVCGSSWGGGFGHTGIITQADTNSWTAFEQNNPIGHAPQILTHNNYNGMLGWFRPKNTPTPVPTPPSTNTPNTITKDEYNAVLSLRDHIKTSTDENNQPFTTMEGYANTLDQDAYAVWKHPAIIAQDNTQPSTPANQPPTNSFLAWWKSLFG